MFSYGIAKVRVKFFCLRLRFKLLARLEEYKVTIKKYRSYPPKIKEYILQLLRKVKKLGFQPHEPICSGFFDTLKMDIASRTC